MTYEDFINLKLGQPIYIKELTRRTYGVYFFVDGVRYILTNNPNDTIYRSNAKAKSENGFVSYDYFRVLSDYEYSCVELA
jgi:hypothetical protein